MDDIISVLLPTRCRKNLLLQSVTSLMDLSADPGRIEICLGYDDDDEETHEFIHDSQWLSLIDKWGCSTVHRRTQRWGYADLQKYVNDLALHSHGRWLLFWNDDAVMETQHWDQCVRDNWHYRMLLHITCSNKPMYCSIFPLVNREWLDIFGMLSPINHTDSWISEICWHTKTRKEIPVRARHDRYYETGRNNDQTWKDRTNYSNHVYHLPENRLLREQWMKRLKSYMDSAG